MGKTTRLTNDEFIERAKALYGDKYDYSKVEYVNNKTKVCIICPKHGEFWQRPDMHLKGDGCKACNSSILEKEIFSFLTDNKIEFIHQARKTNCEKLFFLNRFSLDFYLPKYNAAIECQGIQHFECSKSKKSFYSEQVIHKTIERDKRKKMLCDNNGVKLFYFSNLGINYPYKVFEEKNNLLNEIKNER